MRSWKTPTPEQIERVVSLLGRVGQINYFFDKLENPLWIDPLYKKGFFDRPPTVIVDKNENMLTFPNWPASQFLARVASEAPDLAMTQILRTTPTANPRVQKDLLEAALSMPPSVAVRMVPLVESWIEGDYVWFPLLSINLGKFVAHLARGEFKTEAVALAKRLLVVLSPPQSEGTDSQQSVRRLHQEPRSRFRVWDYGEILRLSTPSLVDAVGLDLVALLCDLLDNAIEVYIGCDKDGNSEDYSSLWLPTVESRDEERRENLMVALARSIRDSAERLGHNDPNAIPDLVALLESRTRTVFRRIALHTLRVLAPSNLKLAIQKARSRALFDDPDVRHEYFLLLQSVFGSLENDTQAEILGWIDQGPDLAFAKERHREQTGQSISDDELRPYVKSWQRDRLKFLKDSLSPDWQDRYDAIVKELGPSDFPDFIHIGAMWVGPTSPKSAAELSSMSDDEIISYLAEWQPSGKWNSPSPEGLGRELQTLVAGDPDRFAQLSTGLMTLDPTYVRGFLCGLKDGLRADKSFAWQNVLSLCRWVATQPRTRTGSELARRRPDETDQDWGPTRQAIAELLAVGYETKTCEIPFDLRSESWDVLTPLTDDPDPTPNHEARYGGSNMDPAMMSINTVRGWAMHAVVHYALWVKRHLNGYVQGFDQVPEVRDILDLHLDPVVEPSVTVRAVYGQWFPALASLDPSWAASNIERIFPRQEANRAMNDAAWDAYVVFNRPYRQVFQLLRDQYALVVDRLRPDHQNDSRSLHDPERRLSEHLMELYWQGILEIAEPYDVLARFYDRASASLKSHALDFVGRSLHNTPDPVPPSVITRLTDLMEWRVAAASRSTTPSNQAQELAGFGWWFASGKFADEWAIGLLTKVLNLSGTLEADHLVVERLASCAAVEPLASIESLRLLIQGDRDGWNIYHWREGAQSLLRLVLTNGDPTARQLAIDTINDLGRRGYVEFRHLLD